MEKPPLIQKIEKAIIPTIESMGFEVVRVLLIGSGHPTLQIMAERPDGTMGIEDCGKLSQAISAVMDVENIIESAYALEVSSPGLDRPLTRLKDFEQFAGHEARIEIDPPVDGRKRFKGLLKGIQDEDNVIVEVETGALRSTIAIPFSYIHKAKLILVEEVSPETAAKIKPKAKAKDKSSAKTKPETKPTKNRPPKSYATTKSNSNS
jgi:ribosome maturation factor RimP